ncbi:hypothetical protein [Nocardia sp. NPDC004260]
MREPRQFRARPQPFAAMQFDGSNAAAIADWARATTTARIRFWPVGPGLWIDTPAGVATARVGDWIICEHGHLRPVPAELFATTYELVEETDRA